MAWGVPLTSARDQWFQWTYAVLPNGNWDAGGQHLVILNNGEVWVHMTRLTSFFTYAPWADAFGASLSESEFNWLGKVHPLGNERVLGDELVYGGEPGSVSHTFGYPYPKETDTYLPASGFAYRGDGNSGMMVTDGTSIFIYLNNNPSSGRASSWWKINPATLNFEKIAGGLLVGNVYADASIGLNATFRLPGQAVVHNGYMYFIDSWENNSNSAARTVRRMSLTPPYAVETVTPDFNSPSGYPGIANGATWLAWCESINPATGMYNVFNDDILLNVGSSTQITSFQIWNGYMYFMSSVDCNPHQFFYLKRCPLAGGALETLFYGLGRANIGGLPSTVERDNRLDSFATPLGVKHPTQEIWYDSHEYTPDLEGYRHDYTTMLVDPDGNLYTQNGAGVSFQVGNQYGYRIARFNLPELIAYYETNGPQRVDREDPQWDTLNNGTTFWESGVAMGIKPGGTISWQRKRHWSGRDGNVPLISHVLVTGWDLNWNSPQWDGKIVFLHPEISATTSPLGISDTTANAMMVGVLQEEGGGPMDLQLNFEGVALKGYGYQPGMPKAYAPEEITLT